MRKTLMLIAIATMAGCQTESERLVEMASRHADEQSQLSRETIELQTQLAEGTRQLVEADSRARRDFIALEASLGERQAELAKRHDELEDERRAIAKKRHYDPVVANAVLALGSLLACLLPLLLAAYLLRMQFGEPEEHSVTELVLGEFGARQPELTTPTHALADQSPDAPVLRIEAENHTAASEQAASTTVPE